MGFRCKLTLVGLLAVTGLAGAMILGQLDFIIPQLDWFSHFPAGYLLCALILMALLAGLRCWPGASVAALLVLASLLLLTVPYRGLETAEDANLTVACANVLCRNDQNDAIAAALPDADIIALLETTPDWADTLEKLRDRWPYQWTEFRTNPFGMAVLSRHPVVDARWMSLIPGGMPAMYLELEVNGRTISMLAIHAMSPQSFGMLRMRDEQFLTLANQLESFSPDTILLGDFNATIWSSAMRKLMNTTGLRLTETGTDLIGSATGTWPTFLPAVVRIPIDHCLVRGDILPVRTEIFDIPGADHLGLMTGLSIGNE
ncbi:MAG: endonuclease/exonuclease/phosphatase family protein [Phycisphaerales bacterium]|nr:endonuclease/exonuclease/phosphatase family protein [Phycisphaerales bacterium]